MDKMKIILRKAVVYTCATVGSGVIMVEIADTVGAIFGLISMLICIVSIIIDFNKL